MKGRREDNINIDLMKLYCEDVNQIKITQGRIQWRAFLMTVMNILVSYEQRISINYIWKSVWVYSHSLIRISFNDAVSIARIM